MFLNLRAFFVHNQRIKSHVGPPVFGLIGSVVTGTLTNIVFKYKKTRNKFFKRFLI